MNNFISLQVLNQFKQHVPDGRVMSAINKKEYLSCMVRVLEEIQQEADAAGSEELHAQVEQAINDLKNEL